MSKKNQEVTGWVGWIGFASFMLILGGMFSAIAGFAALYKETVVYVQPSQTLWVLDYTQWGWVHIIAGLLAMLAAFSLTAGHMYGRIIAVLVALASAVVNFMFIPVYPFWSITVLVIDILVIYAVMAHGKELREE